MTSFGSIATTRHLGTVAFSVLALMVCTSGWARQPDGGSEPAATSAEQVIPLPYGPPLSLEMAKTAMAAAEGMARRNGWNIAIAIVDSGGQLVMFQKADNTNYASIAVAQGKARTALDYRRPTKTLEDSLAAGGGGLRYLGVPGTTPLEGGFPIIREGKIIGAIGASGVASSNDAKAAKAGADALR